jgi:hypothetical protein
MYMASAAHRCTSIRANMHEARQAGLSHTLVLVAKEIHCQHQKYRAPHDALSVTVHVPCICDYQASILVW